MIRMCSHQWMRICLRPGCKRRVKIFFRKESWHEAIHSSCHANRCMFKEQLRDCLETFTAKGCSGWWPGRLNFATQIAPQRTSRSPEVPDRCPRRGMFEEPDSVGQLVARNGATHAFTSQLTGSYCTSRTRRKHQGHTNSGRSSLRDLPGSRREGLVAIRFKARTLGKVTKDSAIARS